MRETTKMWVMWPYDNIRNNFQRQGAQRLELNSIAENNSA